MDKNIQYYTNRNKYNNVCVPRRDGILNYLIKEKFLSEFKTNEEKNRVLDNLGISQTLDNLLQLINEKATLLQLQRYVTMAQFLRKLGEIKPKDEKSKGYFSSYNQLVSAYPKGEVGDWAIVNVNGDWYVYRYIEDSGWVQSETYDNSIDLSEYTKFSDLLNLQNDLEERIQNIQLGGGDIPQNIGEELLRLENRLSQLEANPVSEKFKHKLITQKDYDALESYEKNTLYLITDFTESTSVFGDTFPLILGGSDDSEYSHFGGTFPFVLGGDEISTKFGGTFPFTFGDANYYVGSRFPIKFKQ